jgi:hypothetical protein
MSAAWAGRMLRAGAASAGKLTAMSSFERPLAREPAFSRAPVDAIQLCNIPLSIEAPARMDATAIPRCDDPAGNTKAQRSHVASDSVSGQKVERLPTLQVLPKMGESVTSSSKSVGLEKGDL